MSIEDIHSLFLSSSGISTDTRAIQSGNLFFALKGPSFNANALASEALSKGAMYAIVDEESYVLGEKYILVDDALQTLQELARYHRSLFKGTVLALTGSNGKTTTKELINAVLTTKYNTIATIGNLNNHIGVPLTLLRIKDDTEIAIIEMGANHLGEIAELCTIADPDCGLITNIGKAHIGTFGGFENIVRAKSELYDYLIKKEGSIWLNVNDPVLKAMKDKISEPLTYPCNDCYLSAELKKNDPYLIYTSEDGEEVLTHLVGSYNFNNIAAALAVGKYFNISSTVGNAAIAGYIPTNNRSQVIERLGNHIIMDAYNANPSSMEAALKNLASITTSLTKTVILGDMYELGTEEAAEHRKVGALVRELGLKGIFVGKLMQEAAKANEDALYFSTIADLTTYLKEHPFKNEWILLKGSRGMKMETALEFI